MINSKVRICEECGEIVRRKHIRTIRGKQYCKLCAIQIRKNHRKETLENSEDRDIIKKLTNEMRNKSAKNRRRIKREEKKFLKQSQPLKPKGSKKTILDKNNCYITLEDKQNLFRILLKRGIDSDKAKERISNLIKSQEEIRTKMLNQKKSENEIKIKQQKMLEELWEN